MSAGPARDILFACACPAAWGSDERRWNGKIKITRRSLNMVEFIIYGRSSCMNGVVGKYMSGQYICMPDIDVGCPLSRMSDTFWNKERLSAHMQEADAVTVAYALKALSEYLGSDWL